MAAHPCGRAGRPRAGPGGFAAGRRGHAAGRAPRGARGPAAKATGAEGPERRPRHHPGGQGGEGGEESALFAGDLLRMYQRYAERRGWKTQILDSTVTGLGGIKDPTVAVKGKGGDGAWARLKYEGGGHRGQRGPAPASQAPHP